MIRKIPEYLIVVSLAAVLYPALGIVWVGMSVLIAVAIVYPSRLADALFGVVDSLAALPADALSFVGDPPSAVVFAVVFMVVLFGLAIPLGILIGHRLNERGEFEPTRDRR